MSYNYLLIMVLYGNSITIVQLCDHWTIRCCSLCLIIRQGICPRNTGVSSVRKIDATQVRKVYGINKVRPHSLEPLLYTQ
jgi:hypothetical protein